ncbi:MAG: hypothetical protein JWR09_1889 [Mucilaginibacter sp.]|nr:hypothetical protein [Mucilaginibacter sp.]
MKNKALNLKLLMILTLLFSVNAVFGQQVALGDFDEQGDIGNAAIKGSAVYNKAAQTYLLSGAGKSLNSQLHYLCKKIKGDFILNATVTFIGKSDKSEREAGIIATEQPDTSSRFVSGNVYDSIPIPASMQFRKNKGEKIDHLSISSYRSMELSLERRGNIFSFSVAYYGENYKTVSKNIELDSNLFVGIYIRSATENKLEKAVFSNVRIIIPAPNNFRPYIDYIGSHLEMMNVATGLRKIVYSLPGVSIQAPNWTRDNKQLMYNVNGKIYTYELVNGKIVKLNTGTINNLDGDHVFSFDGKMLGISGPVGNRETIYIMPANGSDNPSKITTGETGPSYLHGWSPDKTTLVFTGKRNNIFDIYSINIATHKETRLTENAVLDDGPEFTPDGKYIYFNSVRTGTMQIWRMKPDGSNQEQITFDEYNNWFPHISPNGKWIVYLSFPKEIDPSDHPFYKNIYIKLMSASGGAPKTIAYVYGGQGTMNEPSWSPDSRNIAFISNSNFN